VNTGRAQAPFGQAQAPLDPGSFTQKRSYSYQGRQGYQQYQGNQGNQDHRPTKLQEEDFPAFPPKRNALTATATPSVPLPLSKPTFAQLATEWTKQIQDEKAEQEAAAIAEAKRLAEEQRDKDNGLMERIKRINLVKKKNQKQDTKQLDIGCASSDHSENEAYNSQDDLTYEEEEEEEDNEEEDGDALWNYRRNKNEMY